MKKQNIKSLQVKKEKVIKLQNPSMAALKGGGPLVSNVCPIRPKNSRSECDF